MGFRGRNLYWKVKYLVTLALLIVFATIFNPLMYVRTAGEETETSYEQEVSVDFDEGQEELPVDLSEEPEIIGSETDSGKELTEMRDRDSKVFYDAEAMESTWIVYSGDVHYQDENGEFAEISNVLVPPKTSLMRLGSDENYLYRNEGNAYTAKFFDMKSEYQVVLSYEEYVIRMGMRGATPEDVIVGSSPKNQVLANLLQPESSIVYENALEDIDLIYQTMSGSVKEYIVLKQPTEQNEFFFHLETEGVTPINTEEGVSFVDANGTEIFAIGQLFAIDSAEAYTEMVSCELIEDDEGAVLKLTVDENYLLDSERVFPVIIDPSLMVSGVETQDTFVSSKNPGTRYYLEQTLRTGSDSTYGTRQIYINFTLPTGIPIGQITKVELRLKKSGGVTPHISAFHVDGGSWSSSTLAWNNKPSASWASGTGEAKNTTGAWWTLDVTTITKNMMSWTIPRNGFVIRDRTETGTTQWTNFYSSDAPSPNKPELVFTYNNVPPPTPTPTPKPTATPTPKPTATPTPKPTPVPLTGFNLNKTTLTLNVGQTATLSPSGFRPSNTTSTKNPTWITTNNTIVELTGNGGQIRALRIGSANIICTIDGISVGCIVTVNPPAPVPLTGFDLNRTTLTLNVGKTATLSPSGFRPSNTTSTKNATWITTNNTIVELTGNGGQIRALKVGTANIICTIDGISVGCTITVDPPPPVPLVRFALHKSTLALNVGKTATLSPINFMPENTTSTKVATWSTSNESIVKLTGNGGQIKAVKGGTAIITCIIDGIIATCKVTVPSSTSTPTPTPMPGMRNYYVQALSTNHSTHTEKIAAAFNYANESFNREFGVNFILKSSDTESGLRMRGADADGDGIADACTAGANLLTACRHPSEEGNGTVHCGFNCDAEHHRNAYHYLHGYFSTSEHRILFTDFGLCYYNAADEGDPHDGPHKQIMGKALPGTENYGSMEADAYHVAVINYQLGGNLFNWTVLHEISHWIGAEDKKCGGAACVMNYSTPNEKQWCSDCYDMIQNRLDNLN